MPETRRGQAEIEPYRLSEISSLIPEFDGDQISLGTFLNACDCANDMTVGNQKVFLVIKTEIKRLLNLHFGDSRDLSSLIQDLQRLKQLQGESPLTFFNRLQVLNTKMHAFIQKSSTLNNDQKIAQCTLIEAMALNNRLTGMEPRLGQIIRAGDLKDLPDAHARIRRELQLSYFETQKSIKPVNAVKRENNTYKGSFSRYKMLHLWTNWTYNNSYIEREGQQTQATNSNNAQQPQTQFRPSNATQPFQGQTRHSVIHKGPNYQQNQRKHYMNFNSQYYENPQYSEDNSYEYYPENSQESFKESLQYGYDYNQYDPNNPVTQLDTADYQNILSDRATNHVAGNPGSNPDLEPRQYGSQSKLSGAKLSLSPLLSVNSKNLFYIKDASNKLRCNLTNTDAILSAQKKEKVRIPHALVHVNNKGEFFTSILNANVIPEIVNFCNLQLEPMEKSETILNFNFPENQNAGPTDRVQIINNELKTEDLEFEEKQKITELGLEYADIFYLEGDALTSTKEIKHRNKQF
ncbi:unnamed protein product [Ceutorhynchus assimilis]|uniref:Uncharacterized protein n=1 Tax=Ceutorhynchus assimilis TaxID=467358 RepID=A0A9N9QE92_9CUCU|nr:unnamed protein product [Ceutorhynchus assimilis]